MSPLTETWYIHAYKTFVVYMVAAFILDPELELKCKPKADSRQPSYTAGSRTRDWGLLDRGLWLLEGNQRERSVYNHVPHWA